MVGAVTAQAAAAPERCVGGSYGCAAMLQGALDRAATVTRSASAPARSPGVTATSVQLVLPSSALREGNTPVISPAECRIHAKMS
jgi:hypothetical protein